MRSPSDGGRYEALFRPFWKTFICSSVDGEGDVSAVISYPAVAFGLLSSFYVLCITMRRKKGLVRQKIQAI